MSERGYDALLILSFGGPEGMDDVVPFLRDITGGRIGDERLAKIGAHYRRFDGVSPINGQNRALADALRADFAAHGIGLPVYFGNRHWHPYVADEVARMRADGVRRALVFTTSATASLPACRMYRDALDAARARLGDDAPELTKLRHFFDHPGMIAANADGVRAALASLPAGLADQARLVFTAHSIPVGMNVSAGPAVGLALAPVTAASGPAVGLEPGVAAEPGAGAASDPVARPADGWAGGLYAAQHRETARLVAEAVRGPGADFDLVWQSRSGPPQAPWLAPDIDDHLRALAAAGTAAVVVSPTGFVSDHMEVAYDLDVRARGVAESLSLPFARAATAGTHPAFVAMVRELVEEELCGAPRRSLGALGVCGLGCPADCCQ
ncbi:MAG: ferrochelatase [Actinomycetia bacterium]|nr:ferrochelatase [Actinomycetes bacterium]